jgi:hypothetical protein
MIENPQDKEKEPIEKTTVTEIIKPEETKKEDAKPKKELVPIEAKENGQLIPRTLDAQWRLATALYNSKLFPNQFDSPEKILAMMQFCYELDIPVMISSRQLMIINKTISIWGDLPLALVRRSGLLEGFKERLYDKDGNVIDIKNQAEPSAAWCYAKRKGGEEREGMFTMAQAKSAGLLESTTYKKYPFYMIQYRARTQVLKGLFSDVLGGISIVEYDYNISPGLLTEDELRREQGVKEAEYRAHVKVKTINELKDDAAKGAGSLFEEKNKQE